MSSVNFVYGDGSRTPWVCIRSNGMTCPTHGKDHWTAEARQVEVASELRKLKNDLRDWLYSWSEATDVLALEPMRDSIRDLLDETEGSDGYDAMGRRATADPSFREGLLAAAAICRAQGRGGSPACPSDIAAVYIERVAAGEQP